jgi:predicted Zn-dependent protease
MKVLSRIFRTAAIFLVLALVLAGCSTLFSALSPGRIVGNIADNATDTVVGAAMGNEEDKKKIETVTKPFEEINPEQEYYVGRAVAATVLGTYPAYGDAKVNDYLNSLGQSLALASDMPETFRGYHFLAMDSDEINAFGAPSGFILVSRGLLRCATSEEEVAAILAHEIGHVTGKHGLKAIKASRWTEAGALLAKSATSGSDSSLTGKLTAAFTDSIADIVKTMITSGYSQDLEKQADLAAVAILQRVGYDPRALVRMLQVMKTRLKPGGKDFAKTHPDPAERITYIEAAIKGLEAGAGASAAAAPSAASKRQARYKAALGKI